MYDWPTMQHLVERAADPVAALTPPQLARFEHLIALDSGRPAAGPLRQRLASALLRLAIALDGQAEAALAGLPVATQR